MPELRFSNRFARCAGEQGAGPLGTCQPRVEKSATDRNIDNFIEKCNNNKCKTCPSLNTTAKVISNITNRTYNCINKENTIASCKSQNLIYLLTCNICKQQFVGETATQLNMRMNTHRTSKSGCEHVINHKEQCVGCDFSFQILEKFISTQATAMMVYLILTLQNLGKLGKIFGLKGLEHFIPMG